MGVGHNLFIFIYNFINHKSEEPIIDNRKQYDEENKSTDTLDDVDDLLREILNEAANSPEKLNGL